MSILEFLETLLIGPLKLIFEIIFSFSHQFIDHPGLCIIALSFAMNMLVLPLYRSADAKQEEARIMDLKLRDGVSHIKKHFHGDEQMMILQTYYRQNHYSPLSVLNGSVSLLLEVPFFMAAYQFLSGLDLLNGISLGPITDLGAPDGMLTLGGIVFNALPVVMTLVNLLSCALYLKDATLRTKLQLYGMALFFLVFLYDSPSGLVFYWTLNNLFSLVKTIFYQLKNPKKVLSILSSAAGLGLLVFLFTVYSSAPLKRQLLLVFAGIALEVPAILPLLRKAFPAPRPVLRHNTRIFLSGAAVLTVLTGVLIPSVYIAASPQEFVDLSYFHNPALYILQSAVISAGTFLIWLSVFYYLSGPQGKALFDRAVWILCGIALVNYLFFGTDLGIISSSLVYEEGMDFTYMEQLFNLLILCLLAAGLWFVFSKWNRIVLPSLLTVAIALGGMSVINLQTIRNSVNVVYEYQLETSDDLLVKLSEEGQNVVVIMLDRAMSEYMPHILHEKPELKKQFDGFTYYSNTISYGAHTMFAAPALFGGYEYTPVEINRRDQETLVKKHNEALKVMPVSFLENGYDVTVWDPPMANYQWITDLSIYDDYPEITASRAEGAFTDPSEIIEGIETNNRNFFCFSLMKTLPLCMQEIFYDQGQYMRIPPSRENTVITGQWANWMPKFLDSYNVLINLPNMTRVLPGNTGTFLMMNNEVAHHRRPLQTPDYEALDFVDNTAYEEAHMDRFALEEQTLIVETEEQLYNYHINISALLRLGTWMDYLRENNVYDNTRIIIVSDHGFAMGHLSQWPTVVNNGEPRSAESFYPLLMVKDFNSKGFQISDSFMTNADVPTLAMEGLIAAPKNPFTGNPINSSEKTAHEQFVILTDDQENRNTTDRAFPASAWMAVKDSIWDLKDCNSQTGSFVLKEHHLP